MAIDRSPVRLTDRNSGDVFLIRPATPDVFQTALKNLSRQGSRITANSTLEELTNLRIEQAMLCLLEWHPSGAEKPATKPEVEAALRESETLLEFVEETSKKLAKKRDRTIEVELGN